MFFLPLHMWLWMLLAALSGGLIGWALRCRRCARETEALVSQRDTAVAEAKTLRGGGAVAMDNRMADLEAELASERDEVAGLKAKLAAAAAAGVAGGASIAGLADEKHEIEGEEDAGAVQWRNRYLESRVRFLEGKLADLEKAPDAAHTVADDTVEAGDDVDVARLKWRNRYLEGRVRYLEEDAASGALVKPSAVAGLTRFSETMQAEMIELSSPASHSDAAPSSNKKAGKSNKAAKPKSKSKAKKEKKATRSSEGSTVENRSIVGLTDIAFMSVMEKAEGYVAGDATGRPPTLKTPIAGKADDLREIAGVGPKLESLLHELGVYHFAQIAAWGDEEIDWVDERLTFKGRIRRENWVDQCKLLARGEETDGKLKYKEGKHS